MRDCNKCIHHISGSCSAWECDMQTLEDYRDKAIDEFASELENHSIYADIGKGDEVKKEWVSPVTRIKEVAEQMKAGGVE